MKINNKMCQYFAYGLLILLVIITLIYCCSFKKNITKKIEFSKKINQNSNKVFNNENKRNLNNSSLMNENIVGYSSNNNYSTINNSKNTEGFINIRENFESKPEKVDKGVLDYIENKLKGITSEIGGENGKKEIKQILTNTKKVCNLESAKCMMNMIDEHKGPKTINLEKLLEDDSSENCIKCKKYTELSKSIQSIIDNL
tara:strand:- start:144 stop:743 length:600 start_codon:yes stop_codon:yes gene_type:complete